MFGERWTRAGLVGALIGLAISTQRPLPAHEVSGQSIGVVDLDWVIGASVLTGPLPESPRVLGKLGGRIQVRPGRSHWAMIGELSIAGASDREDHDHHHHHHYHDEDYDQLVTVEGSFAAVYQQRAGVAVFYGGPMLSLIAADYEQVRADVAVHDDTAGFVGLGGVAGVQIDGGDHGWGFMTIELRGQTTTPADLGPEADARLDRIEMLIGGGVRF